MKTLSRLSTILLLGILVFSLTGNASAARQSVTSICDNYGGNIKSLAKQGEYLDAIIAAAGYEQELLALYPKATFERGLFQSEKHHISFHSTFDGWTREDLFEGFEDAAGLQQMGVEIPLTLLSENEEEVVSLFFMDWARLTQVMGFDSSSGTGMSDQELLLFGQIMSAMFGVVDEQDFEEIGDHHVLKLAISSPMLGPPVDIYLFDVDNQLYGFFLVSTISKREKSKGFVVDLIKTIDFDYMPPDKVKIDAARRKITGSNDVAQILDCVRELAIGGEYGTACYELTNLRLILAGKMPGPEIDGQVGRYAPYGITLKNPDTDRWKLYVEWEGGIGGLVLEDRYGVSGNGIVVGVINTVIVYGPTAVEMIESSSEEDRKLFISNGGRGGLMGMGGVIESERYRNYKGDLAYEGIASTNMPNTKVKGIFILKPGYLIMILIILDASNFDENSDELEELLEKNLEI